MIKLKDLLNEELIGKYKDTYEVFKNPKSIKRMSGWSRGISFPNGDLFVIDGGDVVHTSFSRWLNSNGYSNPDESSIEKVITNVVRGYIEWQRKNYTNDFYLSESTPTYDPDFYVEKKYIPYFKKYSKKVKAKNPKCNFILKGIWDD